MAYTVKYWQQRIKYYRRKYGKDSIEVKSAKLNLQKAIAEAVCSAHN